MKDGAMSLPDTQRSDDEAQAQTSQPPSPVQTMEAEMQSQNMQTELPFQNMQSELHSKGAVLTKAWSDLFSFITKYQAELTVKDNAIEIAQKEICVRKRQLDEMKPAVEAGNDEIIKLQEEIHKGQRLLNKTQSELSVKEQMLSRMQSDLNYNAEMFEKSRSDLLLKQTEVVRYRGDLERLKSELTVKEEQILIKDNLLKKLQNQLMKENAELKEQLEIKERTLDMERRSHELTKRSLRDSKSKSSSAASQAVIEIPDSPPTLDLSVEHADFGLSNIISMAESQSKPSQPMEHDQSQFRLSHSNQDSALSRISSLTTDTFSDLSNRHPSHSQGSAMAPSPSKEQWSVFSPSVTSPLQQKYAIPTSEPMQMSSSDSINRDSFNPVSSASDTFFPLSVSQEDDKSGIDTSTGAMLTDSGRDPGMMPGTPSSGTSDSNQGQPVPISGPIPSAGMSPGGGAGDGKLLSEFTGQFIPSGFREVPRMCCVCHRTFSSQGALGTHMRTHTDERPFKCNNCGKRFRLKHHMQEHVKYKHSQDRPYKCDICGKCFALERDLKRHFIRHTCIC